MNVFYDIETVEPNGTISVVTIPMNNLQLIGDISRLEEEKVYYFNVFMPNGFSIRSTSKNVALSKKRELKIAYNNFLKEYKNEIGLNADILKVLEESRDILKKK